MSGALTGHRMVAKADALKVAVAQIGALQHFGEAYLAGSLRRGNKAEVGDVDIVLVVVDDAAWECALIEVGCPSLRIGKVNKRWLRDSYSYVSGRDKNVQVDLYRALPEYLGAMLMFLTGSAALNIIQRRAAQARGRLLNQYGVFVQTVAPEQCDYAPKTGVNAGRMFRRVAGATERDCYAALRLDWLEPEEREV